MEKKDIIYNIIAIILSIIVVISIGTLELYKYEGKMTNYNLINSFLININNIDNYINGLLIFGIFLSIFILIQAYKMVVTK